MHTYYKQLHLGNVLNSGCLKAEHFFWNAAPKKEIQSIFHHFHNFYLFLIGWLHKSLVYNIMGI